VNKLFCHIPCRALVVNSGRGTSVTLPRRKGPVTGPQPCLPVRLGFPFPLWPRPGGATITACDNAGRRSRPTTPRRPSLWTDHPGPPDGARAEPVGAATGAWRPLPRSWGNCPRGSPLVAYANNRPPTRRPPSRQWAQSQSSRPPFPAREISVIFNPELPAGRADVL
jgi:hypothetical protein